MPWPNNNVAGVMVGEAVSNGGWNAVLSFVFDCPTYLVVPEQRMPPRRFDLAILKVAVNGLFFAFEGKGMNYNWDTLAAEVRQCCQAIRVGQGYTYGMGGNGPECIIVEWDGTQLKYLYIDGQGNLAYSQYRHTHHITNDQAAILQILQEIRRIH
ncbi:uncharacterized protein QC761_0024480 [Podospora bellae-mahoneyi]|uniref:Uncharacterized protein n=1 Tax=Podospora bellae-mahoneyi TaxID=2093777 RepID=A0ABR0G1X2_9PEZI|nr:hypothetical protein QC761_0024480 [Podospora bellae-mahoneyi]